LLSRYQTHKKITVSFEEATRFIPVPEVQITEQNPFRISLMVNRRDVNAILQQIMSSCAIEDISTEEEEIGNVIEKIYLAADESE